MTLTPISVVCPQCGSGEVFYSCKPECCYNHVCSNCYTTFELETARVGEVTEDFEIPPDPDSERTNGSLRAVPRAAGLCHCESWSTPAIRVCACKALLTLGYTEIAPGISAPIRHIIRIAGS